MAESPALELVGMDRPDKLSAAEVARLEGIYKRGERTIRRWWKDGAPILAPEKMAAWWERNYTWEVPQDIRAAAVASLPAGSATSAGGAESEKKIVEETPLDISAHEVEAGEAVAFQRRMVKGLAIQLEAAYLKGSGSIDLIRGRYDKALGHLRGLEAGEREAMKQSGQLIPRPTVIAEVTKAVQLLKATRDSMERKVIELCPSLTIEQRAEVAAGIRTVREKEDRILRNLKSIKGADYVAELLAE